MKEKSQPQKSLHQKLFGSRRRLIFDAAVILSIILLAGLVFLYFTHNFARDEAMPIERELLAAGAVKVCEDGDAGRGATSRAPKYSATFTINAAAEKVDNLIKKVAQDNGYNHLNIAHTDYKKRATFKDNSSKKSPYIGFTNGSIAFTAQTYPDEKNAVGALTCTFVDKDNLDDANQTTFGVGILLPYAD